MHLYISACVFSEFVALSGPAHPACRLEDVLSGVGHGHHDQQPW